MGYFLKNIAKETQAPKIVSLAHNPNYIQFESLNDSQTNKKVNVSFEIISTIRFEPQLIIEEVQSKAKHIFNGTRYRDRVNNNTFFVEDDNLPVTAENVKECLLKHHFFKSNFKITVPPKNDNGTLSAGNIIKIESVGSGVNYAFKVELHDKLFMSVSGNPEDTTNNDSIDGGLNNSDIRIELYKNTGVFLGMDGTPKNGELNGEQIAELTKFYFGDPIWFNLNSLLKNYKPYSNEFLNASSWCNSGTALDFRAIAKRSDGVNFETFYISDVLFCVNGYKRNLDENNIDEHIYNTQENNIVKPLTNSLNRTHINGQTQYFNFILSDAKHLENLGADEYSFGITYRLYTQSDRFIAEVSTHERNRKLFDIVNTIKLDIEGAMGYYENVGKVEAYLTRGSATISEPITYSILPKCLHEVNDFAFLNSLGGWDSFNFGGDEKTDFNTEANTIFKTQTPSFNISSEIESVYSKDTKEQFIVSTSPIRSEVVEWLKELSSSPVVYELKTKRLIIVDSLQLKTSTKDELYIVEMKFRYSDSYNTLLK